MVETNTAPTVDRDLQKTFAGIMAPQVEQGVANGIEEKLEDVRHGRVNFFTGSKDENPGFFQQLLGMLFQFLEAIGLDKMVAGWLGMHIPDGDEKKALSGQITKSLSEAFATKDKDGKLVATQMGEDELKAALTEKLKADIKNNPALKNFSDENVAEAVDKAVSEATSQKRMAMLKDLEAATTVPTVSPTVAPLPPGTSPEQAVKTRLGEMADNVLNSPALTADAKDEKEKQQITAKANAIKDDMINIGAAVILAYKDEINDPRKLAERYVAELQKTPKINATLQSLGIDLSKPERKDLFIGIFTSQLDGYKDVLAQAVSGQPNAVRSPAEEEQIRKAQLQGKISASMALITATENEVVREAKEPVSDIIIDQTVSGVAQRVMPLTPGRAGVTGVNPLNWDYGKLGDALKANTWGINGVNPLNWDIFSRVGTTYSNWKDAGIVNAPNGHSDGDIKKAKENLYAFAQENGGALSKKQRDDIAESVGEGFRLAVNDRESMGDREKLATRVKAEILAQLELNRKPINDAGTSVETIKDNTGRDVFAEVAQGAYNKVMTDDKVFESLSKAQKTIAALRVDIAETQSTAAVDQNAGISGAQIPSNDTATQLANRTQQRSNVATVSG